MLVIRISSTIGKNLSPCVPAKEIAGKGQTGICFPQHISQEKLLPLQEFFTLDRDSRLAGLRITSRDAQFFQQINLSIISVFVLSEAMKEMTVVSTGKAKKDCRMLFSRSILKFMEQHRLLYALV